MVVNLLHWGTGWTVAKISIPCQTGPPGLILAAKSGPPLPISVPLMESKQVISYSWMNASTAPVVVAIPHPADSEILTTK